MTFNIGCDLGGTNIKAGIVNLQTGTVIHSKTYPTLAQDGQEVVMERMAALIQSLIKDSDIALVDKVEVVLGPLGSDAGILAMAIWAASEQSQSIRN